MTKSCEKPDNQKNRKVNWIEISFAVLFAIQFLVILYFNLRCLGNHMGFDSSWSYLKAALIWKEKSFSSIQWVDQTNIFLDSSLVIATIIYAITGKLLFSYGIANMIVVVLIIFAMRRILVLLDIDRAYRLAAYNLIICPFLTNGFNVVNELGYFNVVLSGPAFYSIRVLIALLIVKELIYIKKKNKYSFSGYAALLLCVLAGISSGVFIIAVILLPYLIYEFELVFIENNIKRLVKKETLYGVFCSFCVVFGKLLAKFAFHIKSYDDSRTWTSIEKIWTNTVAVFQGFMKLFGVLPVSNSEVEIMSKEGVFYVFPIIIFMIALISIGFAVKTMKQDVLKKDGVLLFCVNVVAVNFLMYSFFNAGYGSELFEERYLVTTFMIIIIVMAVFLNSLDRTKLFSLAVIAGLLVALFGNDFISNRNYIKTTNDSWQMQDIKTIADSEDGDLVYVWGDDLVTLGRALRVYDMNHVYKVIKTSGGYYHWGDYRYYEDNSDYSGGTLLIVQKGADYVPENVINQYTLISELNMVDVYKCDYNPIDMASGLTGIISVDYPGSIGMHVAEGEFEDNDFVSNGEGGYVMWGPNCSTKSGNYDFVLYYQILDEKEGENNSYFDVAIDIGTIPFGNVKLEEDKETVTISDIQLEEGHTLEYRVVCDEGTIIKIDRIEIYKR